MIDHLNSALADRYRVEGIVGRGGMATVYRAVDLRHERVVAIKVMHPNFAETVGRDRFLREIRVTAGLSHPHILPLYDSGDANGVLFYVMPFVDGVSLRQRLEREPQLPLDDVRKVVGEVALALSHAAKQGIVHRDIKPENILLAGYSPNDNRRSWNTLVADFGIAVPTLTRGEHLTGTGMAIGSPGYMSPEQAVGERVDHRTDVWSLGCITYEMLAGTPPRGVPTFKRAGLPASVTHAVLRALANEPSQRFDDARDFAAAIGNDNVHGRPASRRRVFAMAAAAAVVILAGVGAAVTWRRAPARTPHMTRDSVALVVYTRARAAQQQRTSTSIVEAFGEYSRAIARDSGFALAWAGLARTAQYAVLRGFSIPGCSSDSLVALALAAGTRAVTLDSTASEVWLTRARVMETVEPTSRTSVLNDLRRALAQDSTNGETWFALGRAREEMLDSAGARSAYERAVRLAPTNLELFGFFALHYAWAHDPAPGMKWADSALAIDPTYGVAREGALSLAIELRDWPLAERHLLAFERIMQGPDRISALAYRAWLAFARGDVTGARSAAVAAERIADSVTLTKHVSASMGLAFTAAGDTIRAYRWLSAFSPRGDMHFQLHLHRDPMLAWLADKRYRAILIP